MKKNKLNETYTPNLQRRCPHCQNMTMFIGCDFDDSKTAKRLTVPSETLSNLFLRHIFVPVGLEPADNRVITTIRLSTSEAFIYLAPLYCPLCSGLVIFLYQNYYEEWEEGQTDNEFIVWPHYNPRYVSEQVPSHIATDYQEAAAILEMSPKASAAISRRCLQTILREAGGADHHNLVDQIEAVKPTLPTYIAENIDAIRNIGNFAAHPIKAQANGQIIDVEPGEAEWNLNVLSALFDFYYVQPDIARKKREALNKKLNSVGKPPMK